MQLLRHTYQGVSHCVIIIDVSYVTPDAVPDFHFLSWNPATEKMTGITGLTALGKSPEDIFGADYGASIRQRCLDCLNQQRSITYEEQVPFRGNDRWCLTTINPILNADQHIHRIVLTTFDITDRKTAEMTLQVREVQYRSIFEAVNDGIIVSDLETGAVVEVNPALCQMHGYTREEFLQLSLHQIVHLDSQHQVANYLAAAKVGETFSCEAVSRCQDNTLLPVDLKGVPFSYNGKPHALGVVRDISDRKAAAAALSESEAKFRRLVEDANDVVFSLDPQGHFTYLSPQFTKTFGYAVSDFLQQPFALLIHPDDILSVSASIEQLYATGQKQTGLECRVKTQSGSWIWVVCNNSPIKNLDGQTVGLQGIARDVTEQKQAEIALQQKAQELETTLEELQQTQLQMIQSEKMSSLGQLVAGVAHEINNPVSFIYGNMTPAADYTHDLLGLIEQYQRYYPEPKAEILEEIEAIDLDFLKEDLPKILGSIRMGAERIREIVSSLRTFSRLDEAACKAVDIHAGIDSSLVILEHRLKATAARPAVQVVKDYGDLPLVECYAGQLNQVIINILSNALDAMEERDRNRTPADSAQRPSTITISTQITNNERLIISVSDNGPGIPAHVQDRIFDPFFTTKPVGKGTGMGMSISYQIVTDNHNGTLRCQSSPQGTTFIIDIPQYQPSAQH